MDASLYVDSVCKSLLTKTSSYSLKHLGLLQSIACDDCGADSYYERLPSATPNSTLSQFFVVTLSLPPDFSLVSKVDFDAILAGFPLLLAERERGS